MIIRSQDKGYIINFQKVDTVCLGGIEGKSVITFTNAQVVTLGTYTTEEKAIKVMDMIQEAYLKTTRMAISTNLEVNCLPVAVVFQMPEDSEV